MTRITDYAIVVLQHFAGRPENTQLSTRDLALFTHLPLPTVSKVMKLLAKKGFLVSHRGASGGYGLSKKPSEISMAEIIQALEGPIAVSDCTIGHGSCEQESTCNVRPHWQVINLAIQDALKNINLSIMVNKIPGPITQMPVLSGR